MTANTSPEIDPVPDQLESVLDPEWLTLALDDLPGGYRVTEVVIEENFKTVADKVRFGVLASGPSRETVRRGYCVKGHFGADDHDSLRGETLFYRHLGPTIDLHIPRAHYTGLDDSKGRSLIIMDDVIAGGGRILGAHQPYSIDTTRQTLRQLARLHAATWGPKVEGADSWLAPRIAKMLEMYPTQLLHELLNDGRGAGLPPRLLDGKNLKAAVRRVAEVAPTCVIHGDTHSGNVYLDHRGEAGWLDWQVVQAGHWATDVSYHLATVLAVEDRRAHERDLLRYYLHELAAGVSDPPSWEEAWDSYRTHFPYGYFLWTITRISSREVVLIHIPRIATAMQDHRTFDLLSGLDDGSTLGGRP